MSPAFATVTVTAATGGSAISADTAGGAYTSLTSIVLSEGSDGDNGTGSVIVKAPTGFAFDTTANSVTVAVTNGNGSATKVRSTTCATGSNSQTVTVTPTAGSFTFHICQASSSSKESPLTLSGLKVRPTSGTPLASGNIVVDTTSTATINGLTKGTTNLGTLTEVVGAHAKFGVAPSTATPTAGVAFSATVTAQDQFGNTRSGFTGAVALTTSDTNSSGFGSYTYVAGDNGVHTYTGLVLKTAGGQSVTATGATKTGSANVTVSPAGAASFTVTGPGSTTAGQSQNYTVTAKDAFANTATGYAGTVHFTSSDGQAVLPSNSTLSSGAGTFPVTLKTAGTSSVTATDTVTSSINGTRSGIVVGAASQSSLTISPSSSTITAGGSQAYTVTSFDAYGNNLGDKTSTSTFGIAPNGSCTTNSCTATAAGPHTVTATNGAQTADASLSVVPAAVNSVTVLITPNELTAGSGQTASAVATAKDAYGNLRAGDTLTVASDGDAGLSSVTNNGNGSYSVTVTASSTPGTQTITFTDGSVTGSAPVTMISAPSITTVSPNKLGQGAEGGAWGQSIIISGANFQNGAAPDFGPGVTVKFTTFNSSTQLTAHLKVDPDAEVGTRDVVVTNPDGGTTTCTGCFTVNAGPKLTSMSPDAKGPGFSGALTFTGSGFVAGMKVQFLGTGVAVTSVSVTSATQATVNISTAGSAPAGARTVVVTNTTDAGSGTCVDCYTVTPAPTVSSVSPSPRGAGWSGLVTINGTNFASGAKVSVSGGAGVSNVVFVNSSQLTATVTLPGSLAAGAKTVTVTNLDAGKGTCTCFSTTAAPTIASASPNSVQRGTSAVVNFTGANFQAGASVTVSGAVVTNVTVNSATSITATVAAAASAPTGARTVTVLNTDGGKSTSTALSFT